MNLLVKFVETFYDKESLKPIIFKMCIAKTTPSKPAIDDIFVAEPTVNNTSLKKE